MVVRIDVATQCSRKRKGKLLWSKRNHIQMVSTCSINPFPDREIVYFTVVPKWRDCVPEHLDESRTKKSYDRHSE